MGWQYIEQEGRTASEALEAALQRLGATRDQVSVKIVREASKGLFGLGAKPVKIRVTLKEDPSSTPEGVLSAILQKMGIEATIRAELADGRVHLTVLTQNSALIIGKRGRTLDAVQYLINSIVNKSSLVKKKIVINTEGYREKREERLVKLAYKLAAKAKKTDQEVVIEPMNPHDRRIIHMTLQQDDQIKTFSRGEGAFRSVVITTKDRHSSPHSHSHLHSNDESESENSS